MEQVNKKNREIFKRQLYNAAQIEKSALNKSSEKCKKLSLSSQKLFNLKYNLNRREKSLMKFYVYENVSLVAFRQEKMQ